MKEIGVLKVVCFDFFIFRYTEKKPIPKVDYIKSTIAKLVPSLFQNSVLFWS